MGIIARTLSVGCLLHAFICSIPEMPLPLGDVLLLVGSWCLWTLLFRRHPWKHVSGDFATKTVVTLPGTGQLNWLPGPCYHLPVYPKKELIPWWWVHTFYPSCPRVHIQINWSSAHSGLCIWWHRTASICTLKKTVWGSDFKQWNEGTDPALHPLCLTDRGWHTHNTLKGEVDLPLRILKNKVECLEQLRVSRENQEIGSPLVQSHSERGKERWEISICSSNIQKPNQAQ